MELVLLSGGSGKRLWPLSNDSRSKQFLKVLQNDEGQQESMVQRVWRQIKSVDLIENSLITTTKSQVEMINGQLGFDVPLIIEPERRDTFAAIALAATYLYSMKKTSLSEVVCILPVDPYVEDRFFDKIQELEIAVNETNADLALIGVNPTYPSSKYGYIIPEVNKDSHAFLRVSHFTEKPTEEYAQVLINQKALWNCGVFAFRLNYIISLLIERGLPIQFDELLKRYSDLPKISFDYEVVEKAKKVIVLPYTGYWKDLGTWNTLTEQMATKVMGNGIMSKDSENTHIINELDIPVAVLGLSNVVVAASPEGILVSEKSASPRIKDMAEVFNQRPMYEERLWGWYRILYYTSNDTKNEILIRRIGINKGSNLSYHVHLQRSEVWTIIKGEGEFVLNDKLTKVKIGDVLQISENVKHTIKATTDLEIIEVQRGNLLYEEDTNRINNDWKYIEENILQINTNII